MLYYIDVYHIDVYVLCVYIYIYIYPYIYIYILCSMDSMHHNTGLYPHIRTSRMRGYNTVYSARTVVFYMDLVNLTIVWALWARKKRNNKRKTRFICIGVRAARGRTWSWHTCHILPSQPILWNRCFPSKFVKSAQNSPKSISEGGRIWRVCLRW